ncbi:mannose-6-phosphate isomerase, class I [Aspergillus clavatus NRRL 1]|uniref:Mannose-6-phosphate isomerase n=1 Tax=Aspergillus clavatus (strain ATCC 1007 / CBS 513.65 / DSM 816 / NCTC 3887 / NRRL 1 / QM 1276 / 107) TaxID=344612 RepID=A1CHF5_ASPCL|nr:mannose-6-phosphate isomerase, class I [Aspergillus clavatus NRRL 1]EAW10310.1 mannose-6-phosphate isomerase, class I [Aspergillus clavatus NRRL 1]
MAESVVQLKCECKHDPWGKKGKDALVAQLWSKSPGSEEIKATEKYSEMWMGTYPTNPSKILATGELLSDYLQKNPQLVGKSVLDRWGPEIPFLPKILSFSKALPLQIHPDKTLAEKLHATDPEHFGDPNHKPEIAIALSNFELFAGFKPLSQIEAIMKLKPLEHFVPSHKTFDDELLRQICKELLSTSPVVVSETLNELQNIPESQFGQHSYIPGMLERLRKQYSEYDNGNLVAALLMNYLSIGPGEAVCVPADSMHAYLHGDIMECMARSDNVLNTGFCPRPGRDDVNLFSQALTFQPHSKKEVYLPRKKSDKGMNGKTDEYAPPFSEFNVLATCLGPGEKETHKAILGPSIMIVTKGSGQMNVPDDKTIDMKEGYVYFIGQGVAVDFSTEKGMAIYRPYAE